MLAKGIISRVSGPVVIAKNMSKAQMYELVKVGELELIGEIIRLEGDKATIQVYEETSGIKPGEKVEGTGKPLSVELGPGLIGQIYDGVQRPLPSVASLVGPFIKRGVYAPALNRDKKWHFKPIVKKGDKIVGGDILGIVQETPLVTHKVLLHPEKNGKVIEVVPEGDYTVLDTIATIETSSGKEEIKMFHTWPVRKPRPFKERMPSDVPLITGQRIIDTFFPICKGGTAAIPGGFGTGKCVAPDTPILLSNGEIMDAESLFYHMSKDGVILNDGGESYVICSNPVNVIALYQNELKNMDSYIAYKGLSKQMVRIKTRRGRSVTITPFHPLFVITQDLKIFEIPAGNIKPGMYILAPRKLNIKASNEYSEVYELLDDNLRCCDSEIIKKVSENLKSLTKTYGSLKKIAKILNMNYNTLISYHLCKNKPTLGFLKKLSNLTGEKFKVKVIKGERQSTPLNIPDLNNELAEFLGLILSDGTITYGSVCFFNNNAIHLKRFSELCFKLFGIKPKLVKTRTTMKLVVHSVVLAKFLEKLGIPRGRKSDSCRVPKLIMKSSDSMLASFLNGYIAGDGSLYGYTLELTTASKGMWIDIAYALTRLGILYRLSEKYIKGKAYYRIFIEGKNELKKLYEKLSNSYEYPHLKKIRNYINKIKEGFNSIDIVPISGYELKYIIKKFGIRRKIFEKEGVYIKNYTNLNEKVSVETFKKIVNILEKYGKIKDNENLNILKQLKKIAELLEHIYFDEIIEVKTLEFETPVYDLSIPETGNFVGGIGPLLLHNTVMQHQLAQWADADIVLFIGCGERGNEMAEVLERFPSLKDPRSGQPLMNRTILVANVSNMPIAAREASVYTGITMAEYYRDMGYDIAMQADSTSRWAEALREVSGRLEEMPGEEGYPAYLASRIAEFYERAGRVICLGSDYRVGSISIVGAVSPPGGDFSEPVTQCTLRMVKVFWALDTELAYRRHFPAIHWLTSYSLYTTSLQKWFEEKISKEWNELREKAMYILQQDAELEEIVRLVGPDALSDPQRAILEAAKMIKEDYLMQHAYHPIDTYCPLNKSYQMLKTIIYFYEKISAAIEKGVPLQKILGLPIREEIARMKIQPYDKIEEIAKNIRQKIDEEINNLLKISIEAEAK
jgi:V/A-type H+-transporting ATPase subunit A